MRVSRNRERACDYNKKTDLCGALGLHTYGKNTGIISLKWDAAPYNDIKKPAIQAGLIRSLLGQEWRRGEDSNLRYLSVHKPSKHAP